ncbi:hypothetical protein PHYBOEH_002914 [Phytophthora boehmeriae]|uniref:RNA 3'-terminal phosphate cyclase domain-containing protein n=1 Tax=Phytophthora boehmeriae TaxID=109152 RepID=A0A8T1V2G1_9STRA|nr:hypothetical protein PHYBOEH_002914 [Phytophthora boehmeriae]
MDFMQVPLRALLERFGLAYDVEVVKRMFFPGSDPAGEVKVSISYPANVSTLQAISITEASTIISRVFIRVTAFGVSATEQLANRYGDSMKTAVKENFSNGEHDIPIDVDCIVEATPASLKKKIHRGKKSKEKTAVSALIMLETATGGLLSVDRTVGPSEIGSQYLAEQMLSKLVGYLQSGACVDEHLADNAVVFMALARGTSRLRVPCKDQLSSQHLETALEIAARVSGATYRLYDEGTSVILEVDGVGVRCLPT